jgi:holo-[acyl-carrier protein] synthase
MILGTGIDLVEVQRIRHALEKFGQRFLERILLPDEVSYCQAHRDPTPFVAGRFAAKEAVSKAFGTGISRRLGWRDVEVRHKESGEPFVVLHGGAQKLLADRGARIVHLSLSHTDSHATAVAILEG